MYVSRSVFLILMVHHFLHTSPCKMFVFERSVTCSFFSRNCTHILTRSQWKRLSMFLVIIASKGTSLRMRESNSIPSGKYKGFTFAHLVLLDFNTDLILEKTCLTSSCLSLRRISCHVIFTTCSLYNHYMFTYGEHMVCI